MSKCDCKACKAADEMREIHTRIAAEKRDPTDAEYERMYQLLEDIIHNGKFYK